MYNSLLHIDCLHKGWESGNESNWQKELAKRNNSLPVLNVAEQRLITQPVVEHDYFKNNCETFSSDTFKSYEVSGKRIVKNVIVFIYE